MIKDWSFDNMIWIDKFICPWLFFIADMPDVVPVGQQDLLDASPIEQENLEDQLPDEFGIVSLLQLKP